MSWDLGFILGVLLDSVMQCVVLIEVSMYWTSFIVISKSFIAYKCITNASDMHTWVLYIGVYWDLGWLKNARWFSYAMCPFDYVLMYWMRFIESSRDRSLYASTYQCECYACECMIPLVFHTDVCGGWKCFSNACYVSRAWVCFACNVDVLDELY